MSLRILAISGSLRAASSSRNLLQAAASFLPKGASLEIYEGLASLPHFNPDLDKEGMAAPGPVAELRQRLQASQALLICSPEYAHGVPGSLKNALDWLVSSPLMPGRAVGIFSQGFAYASLRETLSTMSVKLLPEACLDLGSLRSRSGQDPASDPAIQGPLKEALQALAAAGKAS